MADAKEQQRGTSDLVTKEGKTHIANEVVAKIVALATKEIAGVHDMGTLGLSDTLTGFAQRAAKTGQSTQGVQVEVGEREVAIDLKVVVEYGVSIPQVATAIRRNLASRINTMTGLTVKEVNIDVSGLYFAEEAKEKPAERPEPRVA
ncbi:MAG: Asp23/Gls24 family envelope stress response protein [Nitrospirota bacterium]|nr:Asp23/Gls24 family envelope stress response protein [Nitrospirota bacterium]MDH5587232.1 Asp23/Gls24 family envelope stress response protein [Nitrospirota bacterium]MDH5774200.1 Asp23/Gls24 family envelope stress response protein [Nitrospirota bacterium]